MSRGNCMPFKLIMPGTGKFFYIENKLKWNFPVFYTCDFFWRDAPSPLHFALFHTDHHRWIIFLCWHPWGIFYRVLINNFIYFLMCPPWFQLFKYLFQLRVVALPSLCLLNAFNPFSSAHAQDWTIGCTCIFFKFSKYLSRDLNPGQPVGNLLLYQLSYLT